MHMAGNAGSSSSNKRPVKVLTASQFHTSTVLKRQKAIKPAAASCQSAFNLPKHLTVQSFNPLSAPYKTFKTQKEAFDFLDKQPCAAILRTFAQEVSATGKRVFIVTSAEQFWQRYKELPASERHHYEIIREATPCNLYFDLEFCPHTNPDLEGPRLVQLLITGVTQQLKELYDIPFHSSFVLELDSSTPTKFSRHLVVRLPGLAFADCCHAGRFARLVLLRLLQWGQFSSGYGQLLVKDKEGAGMTSFVDMGVYTRNRAFRLYLSSKFGKDRILRLTNRFGGAKSDPQAVFPDLLVSVLHNSNTVSNKSVTHLAGPSNSGHPTGLTDTKGWPNVSLGDGHQQQWPQHAAQFGTSPMTWQQSAGTVKPQRQMASLLYCEYNEWQQDLQQLPIAWQQVPMLQLNPLPHGSAVSSGLPHRTSGGQQKRQEPGAYTAGDICARTVGAAVHDGFAVVHHGASPYPLLEHFITSICNQGGVQGEIRSWVSMPASASVAFNIRGNRWCGNVERQHKSNGIYYVVDLAGGVYYQKCYDPECRSYRSNCMPLPTTVWQKYRQKQPQQLQQQAVDVSAGVDSNHHPRQQHGTVAEEQGGDEDEECLELLQHFESIQQQQRKLLLQQQEQAVSAADATVAEDDDLCLKLLEQIEQQAGLAA